MTELFPELKSHVSTTALLGYLNFSDGKPDPKWQQEMHRTCAWLLSQNVERWWSMLSQWLRQELQTLHQGESTAFRDIAQAELVLTTFEETLPAYREHHSILLAHLSEEELFQPFFLIRVLEAVLSETTVEAALKQLNDFVGYRPIATLETRSEAEPYPHERFRPIPLYIREVGVSCGPYQELITGTLELLQQTDADILAAAQFDFDMLDELAMDVRAFDQRHPVNRRPNYVFGEWDPHCLDEQGYHRRLIARRLILDAALERVDSGEAPREELMLEATAVIAGTLLMASGISGRSPTSHDASQSIGALIPAIAQYRDAFYAQLIARLPTRHRQRLEEEHRRMQQPFAAARQHMNAWLGSHRARHLQHRFLALLFAEMGYPDASREEARRIPTASLRALSEMLSHLSAARAEVERGQLEQASRRPRQIEELIHLGIDCGAVVDPWNILGFQGLFPFSSAQQDSVRDPRVEELLQIVEQTLNLYATIASEASSRGEKELTRQALENLRAFAEWWDQFASVEIGDLRRVSGQSTVTSAESVANALGHWHDRGHGQADLAFWREHIDSFQSPHAFALVIDALLQKQDYQAAMALLVNEVGQGAASSEEGQISFYERAMRWMAEVTAQDEGAQFAKRFFELLEANAEEQWEVPTLTEVEILPPPTEEVEDEEDLYEAAYEGVSWQDSTAGEEGAVVDGPMDIGQTFLLEEDAERIQCGLRFQLSLARLWQVATHALNESEQTREILKAWLSRALEKQRDLTALLNAIHAQPVPTPAGSYDSMVEYDRRRGIKEQLIHAVVSTSLSMTLTVSTICSRLPEEDRASNKQVSPRWGPAALRLERALFAGDREEARSSLRELMKTFEQEPLLTSRSESKHPEELLRTRLAQAMLHTMLTNLPRLGLFYETWDLLRLAHRMEQSQGREDQMVSDLGRVFAVAFTQVIEQISCSIRSWEQPEEDPRNVDLLNQLITPFLRLWSHHCRSVQLSPVETIVTEDEWQRLLEFVKRYGRDLFHARFMTMQNLRGILLRGVDEYLTHLEENPQSLGAPDENPHDVLAQPSIRLIDELDREIPRQDAVRWLEVILHSVVAHYQEFLDYNTSSSRSDYGENLYVLLDQLRLKVAYDRQAWTLQPLMITHDVLAQNGLTDLAMMWEQTIRELTRGSANEFLSKLESLERKHGTRLTSIRDRLEERFVKPLLVDRLRALIEPAMKDETVMHRFQEELRTCAEVPTGSGLDLPAWLYRLQEEVQRVHNERQRPTVLTENGYQVPRREMTIEELESEMARWQ